MDKNNKSLDININGVGETFRKCLARSIGLRDKDLEKPYVAVVHGWSEATPGHFHLKEVAHFVKGAISSNGGTPAEIIIPGICGSMSGGRPPFRYNLPYRDFASFMVEIMLNLNLFDGAVLIPTCDNVIPAYLIAAARTNIPCLILTGGYMQPGEYNGKPFTGVNLCKEYGKYITGELEEKIFNEMIDCACPTPGACPIMGTAHTMRSVSETLGMSLPGDTSLASNDSRLYRFAKEAGEKILYLIEKNIKPRDIMTKEAFENAIKVVQAVGGSPNAVVHIPAIARELDIEVNIDIWNELGKKVPFICKISPNCPEYTMKDLDRAGGIQAVLHELDPLLSSKQITVNGKTLGENYQNATVKDRNIIKSLDKPFMSEGGIMILKGNLAPEGSIVKQSAVNEKMMKCNGLARVFNSQEEAMEALMRGVIKPKDVVVIRYEGPRGSPGAIEIMNFLHFLTGEGLGDSVAVITDGRVSGSNIELIVGYISPEAQVGGPLAIVKDGDEISIDVYARKINLHVNELEIKKRFAQWEAPAFKEIKGVLGAYAKYSTSLLKGATIV